jgi:hypothetical protein
MRSTRSLSSTNLKLEPPTDRNSIFVPRTGLIAAARTANSPTTDGAVGLIYNLSNRVADLDAAAAEAFFL